eukprot:5210627-Pyramimonas_sp.AAC.2
MVFGRSGGGGLATGAGCTPGGVLDFGVAICFALAVGGDGGGPPSCIETSIGESAFANGLLDHGVS